MQLLYPVFALVALTYSIVLRLAYKRITNVRSGRTDGTFYETYLDGAEPHDTHLLSRHYSNLLESPMLFYAVIALAFATGNAHGTLIPLAWLYVVARYVHCYIHLGSNVVIHRFQAFMLGWATMIAMWIVLLVRAVSA